MTGIIEEGHLADPDIARIADERCRCGHPIGVGEYVAVTLPFKPLFRGGPATVLTTLHHRGCVAGMRWDDAIGKNDEPLCEGK